MIWEKQGMYESLDSQPVLEVENLSIAYETRKGAVEAVKDVSFSVRKGETVGLVGESGCGKTTIAFGIVNFLGPNGKITRGSVRFQGQELVGRSEDDLNRLRGDRIAMVFQDPMQALNPSVKLGEQLMEVLTFHHDITEKEAWRRSVEMLRRVHMPDPEEIMDRYTHQISGGQQQRVVIAMAMLNNPALLIMDEPTTALDVTVEAAVLDLLEELKQDFETANIFITHNLGVMARVSDYLCVMYAGELVERGETNEIFHHPSHPYTLGLLASIPRLGKGKLDYILRPIRGRVPPLSLRCKDECIFAPRCAYATQRCRERRPGLQKVARGHFSRCIFAGEIGSRRHAVKGITSARKVEIKRYESQEDGRELLRLRNMKVYYPQESNSIVSVFGLGEKKYVKAVEEVSISLSKGRILGVVGESGCGKSTLAKGIIGLEKVTGGEVEFLGVEVAGRVSARDRRMVQEMQMIFQNPDSTLNPSYPVGKQIARPIRRFKTVPRKQVKAEVLRLLKAVRLSPDYYNRLPGQLSGGEKQRVGIARALASRPDLIICDEPVSALDVSVQAAVINLLLDIQRLYGSSMIFISHDLSVVRYLCDDIAVMYLGQIVEIGQADAIYDPPYHPYTEALLSAVPVPDPEAEQKQIRLEGEVPSALSPPSGCRFHTRCHRRHEMLPHRGRICEEEHPPWQEDEKGHRIFCHIPIDTLGEVGVPSRLV